MENLVDLLKNAPTKLFMILASILFFFALLVACTAFIFLWRYLRSTPIIDIGKVEVGQPFYDEDQIKARASIRVHSLEKSVSYRWWVDKDNGQISGDNARSTVIWLIPNERGLYIIHVEIKADGVLVAEESGDVTISTPIAASPPTTVISPLSSPQTPIPTIITPTDQPITFTATVTSTPTPDTTPVKPTLEPTTTETETLIAGAGLFPTEPAQIPSSTPTPSPIVQVVTATPTPTPIVVITTPKPEPPPTEPPTPVPTSTPTCDQAEIEINPPIGDNVDQAPNFIIPGKYTVKWPRTDCGDLTINHYQNGQKDPKATTTVHAGTAEKEITIQEPGETEIKFFYAGKDKSKWGMNKFDCSEIKTSPSEGDTIEGTPFTVTWEPSSCPMVVQYNRRNEACLGPPDQCDPNKAVFKTSGVEISPPPGQIDVSLFHGTKKEAIKIIPITVK